MHPTGSPKFPLYKDFFYAGNVIWSPLTCWLYVEKNFVRAKIVKRPEDYPYFSYNFYALVEENLLLNEIEPSLFF